MIDSDLGYSWGEERLKKEEVRHRAFLGKVRSKRILFELERPMPIEIQYLLLGLRCLVYR